MFPNLSQHFEAPPILAADFTDAGRNRPAVLTISRLVPGVSRTRLSTHEVSGRREARAIAKRLGARPWNF